MFGSRPSPRLGKLFNADALKGNDVSSVEDLTMKEMSIFVELDVPRVSLVFEHSFTPLFECRPLSGTGEPIMTLTD
jgi:hypothetical protein